MKSDVVITSRKLVITLHGIRTFAPWQKELADELGKAGFYTKSLHYGYFSSWKLIRSSKRRRQIEWFREQYTQIVSEYSGTTPSIIAHSFGTYIVARALEVFNGIKFDQVILCGSIIPRNYDWLELFEQGQVKRVLNECAKKDIVVKAAPFFISDAGASGAYGFKPVQDDHLCQRTISKFTHSDYLHVLNFRENWIPFLSGEKPPKDRLFRVPFNWKVWVTRVTLLLLFIGFAIGGVKILKRWNEKHSISSSSLFTANSSLPPHGDRSEGNTNIGRATSETVQIAPPHNSPTTPRRKPTNAEDYFAQARKYFRSGNCRRAIEAIEEAVNRDANNSRFKEYEEMVKSQCRN